MASHKRSNTTCLPLRCLANQQKVPDYSQQKSKKVEYRIIKPLGAGTFGKVYLVQNKQQKLFAVKVVAQKSGSKQKQLEIMRLISHYNIPVPSYSVGGTTHFLNLVMEYVPVTLYQVIKKNRKVNCGIDKILIKIYSFQGNYNISQKQRICHRDLKPSNILIDPDTNVLKVCDFGSAKKIGIGQINISYICSRYYRAPELLLGIQKYDMAVDLWSIGCIMVEMLTGYPLFPGESSMQQMIEIVKIIGTPTNECLQKLYQTVIDANLHNIQPLGWNKILKIYNPDPNFVDLIQSILCFDMTARIKANDALSHPYFQDLRSPQCMQYLTKNPNIFVFDKN